MWFQEGGWSDGRFGRSGRAGCDASGGWYGRFPGLLPLRPDEADIIGDEVARGHAFPGIEPQRHDVAVAAHENVLDVMIERIGREEAEITANFAQDDVGRVAAELFGNFLGGGQDCGIGVLRL